MSTSYILSGKVATDLSTANNVEIEQVDDIVIYGRITENIGTEVEPDIVGVEGAIVRAFFGSDPDNLTPLGYTFSGCNGYYMLRLDSSLSGETITIMSTQSSEPPTTPTPAECDLPTVP